VLGLTGADYLLWSWSLTHGPQTMALVCGLALVPLLLALVWMLVVRLLRLLGHLRHTPTLSSRHRTARRVPGQREPIRQSRRLIMRRAGRASRVAHGAAKRRATAAARTPSRVRHPSEQEARQTRADGRPPSSDRLAA
jgi:hypothetical protein